MPQQARTKRPVGVHGRRVHGRWVRSRWSGSLWLALLAAIGSLVGVARAFAEPAAPIPSSEVPSSEASVFFETKVRPLLVSRCHDCHAGDLSEGGLRLDSLPAVKAGGDSGPAAHGGDLEGSLLVQAVRRSGQRAMPPDEPLSAEEVAILERWVMEGLPWSGPGSGGNDDPVAAPRDMPTRIATALRDHWAFTPPVRHTPPEIPPSTDPATLAAWSSPIDRLVLPGIVAAGLSPSPQAEPAVLVRRLWFDLTGLPPPADEVDAFCRDPSDAAFAALVDRLLTSREHAEHWARAWLDLARYADTRGYAFDGQESDYPFAWTYRDWVVDALHDDMPYDRFVTLQLAADLVEPAVAARELAALGFLTVGRTFLGNRHDIIDDRIDLVTRGLMGLTVACARCHDHKYEPVGMADYYALHGIFASCEIPEELPIIGDPPPGPEAEAFAAALAELERKIVEHEQAVFERARREAIAHAADYFLETSRPRPRGSDGRTPVLEDGYELQQLLIDRLARTVAGAAHDQPILGLWARVREFDDPGLAEAVGAVIAAWEQDPAAAAGVNAAVRDELMSARPTSAQSLAEAYGRVVMRAAAAEGSADDTPDLAAIRETLTVPGAPLVVLPEEAMRVARREERTELRKRQRDITRHQGNAPGGPPRAMVLEDRGITDSPLLLRGNPGRPGEKVVRRMPELLGGGAAASDASGRLELAAMITSATNPLTPRLIVDWAWRLHVGQGLVDTPGDLGLRGEPPVHPQLLDDLARRFIDEGQWSLRWLHREIVTSRTWRQSSVIRPELAEADPDNRLLARAHRRRLTWEAWRDSLAVASGSLDLAHPGGRGVDPLSADQLRVRSLYGRLDRQDVPGLMRTFDIANPDTAVHARSQTTVPQQSLAVLNAPLVVEAARRLAARAAAEAGGGSDSGFVVRLWRDALSREPTADELAAASEWLATEAAADTSATAAPQPEPAAGFDRHARLAQAVLATAEFQFID